MQSFAKLAKLAKLTKLAKLAKLAKHAKLAKLAKLAREGLKSVKPLVRKSLKHELKNLSNQNYIKISQIQKSLNGRNRLYNPMQLNNVFSVLDDLCRGMATPFQ